MTLRWPTLRELRLASGLTLFVYIALHLANHALGLISVAVAEHGLDLAVKVWHSVPGTILLYGAAATHISLALSALYRRRTLRMPPLEVLRIALGLGIPILLIGHAVATRLAWEAWRLSPDYSRIVWSLWTSDNEGRQLAMLVPGWLHGCLGVNFAFGHRAWYRRVRPVLFAAALLLPVLGGLGFLAMGKELAADLANREFLDSNAQVDAATRIALLRVRDGALAAWFGLIAAIFVAREVRAWAERRRNAVVTIAYPQRNARVPLGWTVLEASRSHHIAHVSMCGGRGRCSTCRVQVTSGEDHCPPPEPAERATLERIGAAPGVRLACQLRPTGDIGVVPLLAPTPARTGSERRAAVMERELAIVVVDWRNRVQFARSHLPQDVVFLSELFVDTVTATLRAGGGTIGAMGVDSVTAVFGLRVGIAAAAREAVDAAAGCDRALSGLARRCAAEFGGSAEFSILVHAGHGAVGGATEGDDTRVVGAGEVFDTTDALRGGEATVPARILVSARACEAAGIAFERLDWRPVPVPGGEVPLRAATFADGAALAVAVGA